MRSSLITLFTAALLLTCSLTGTSASAATRGTVTGGVPHEVPDWFKESFLEIGDDVDEASEAGKHVMLFFQLNACPYCDRMLSEVFESNPYMAFAQQHFDVIAVNVKGDREIVFNEDITVLEKELAEILKVRATPAILFLDENNRQVARVNGYRSPERFQQVMNFVHGKAYLKTNLTDYLHANLRKGAYVPRDHSLFQDLTDLSSVEGPLMLIFEDSACYDCNEFHDRLISRDDVQHEMKKFTVVRLNTDNEREIVDPLGKRTTARALADEFELHYRPGVLVFEDGNLLRRNDSLAYSFHFKEGLRYIADGYYKRIDYRSYSEQRREELLSSGQNINLGE